MHVADNEPTVDRMEQSDERKAEKKEYKEPWTLYRTEKIQQPVKYGESRSGFWNTITKSGFI